MRLSRLRDMALLAAAFAATSCVPELRSEERTPADLLAALPAMLAASAQAPTPLAAPPPPDAAPPFPAAEPTPAPAPTRTVGEVLDRGVVVTISLASQRMHVFRDGVLWRSSPVSTGKKGKRTPAGVYAVLQKKTFHRSNIYSNAPMPWMQRLTWSGIAIHAGHLPGYPASHGCIRLPKAFARELYRITDPAATAVIVHAGPLRSGEEALALAQASDAAVPISPALLRRERPQLARADESAPVRPPAARLIPAPPPATKPAPGLPLPPTAKGQTIQLAATLSHALANAHWEDLAGRRPELRGMRIAIVPALVNGTQYYRLRASAPDAHATCKALKRAGIACFPVS